jgi:predicted O-linked N-acetylglucosamine transferase (SPINDLY family)
MMSPPGLDCIPYFLADADMTPPDERGQTIIPVVSAYTYDPTANAPGIKPEPPMVKNGYVTFGNFNNPCKLNAEVLSTWLALLKQVPKSRLHTKVYGGITEEWFKKSAVTLGVDPARITFIHNLPRTEDVMAYYTSTVDIALDTWPCAGMLTSLEAMWMGCPVMTLRGGTFLHHQTASILRKLDLPEFATDTPAVFVKATAALSKRPDLLATFRGTIRAKLTASVIRKPDIIATSIIDGIGKAWAHRAGLEKDLSTLVKRVTPA